MDAEVPAETNSRVNFQATSPAATLTEVGETPWPKPPPDAARPEMRETDGDRADRETYEWLVKQSR